MNTRLWHERSRDRKTPGPDVYSVRDETRADDLCDGLVAWVVWKMDTLGDRFLWCRRHVSAQCADIAAVREQRKQIALEDNDNPEG